MKRSVLIAALSTLAAGSAFAQVTVYGRLNETIERQKIGSTSSTQLVDNASRLGFKGTEDLGGGLKAFFLIEHGFNADTGTAAGAFWGRESNVGLEHAAFGKVRLGNMGPTAAYFATADYVSLHNHDNGTSADNLYLYQGGTQLNNAIAYTTPSFGGLVGEVQYGVGEGAARHTTVLAANYDAGALHLGAGYVNGGVASNGISFAKGQEFALRGLYELGALTFGGYYARNEGEATGVKAKRDTVRASVMYTIGAGEVHGNVGLATKVKVNGTSVANSDAKQFTVGYNHNLSKRTKLYGFVTKTDNKAVAGYGSGIAGADLQSVAAGIRHMF